MLFLSHMGAVFGQVFLATAVTAFFVSVVLVLTRHRHGHKSMDHPVGVQKFHLEPTPRVGGIGIYLGLALAWALLDAGPTRQLLGVIMLAGIPALLFGLAEDLTKRVGVLPRLLATMFSGLLACLLSGVALNRLDVAVLDSALAYWPLAVLLTAFAVGGVANAVNIIDGFHGLAGGTVMLMLLALSVIAFQVGDAPLAWLGLLLLAAVAGFWLINYPWGKLFLGDGGAYFVGFALAWMAVLLPMRNPDVSPWASLLVCAYPITEVLYSVLRRKMRGLSPGDADRLHLHSLLASQFIQKHFPDASNGLQNACVAPFVWCFVAVLTFTATLFYDHTAALVAGYLAAVLAYHLTYRYLLPGSCALAQPVAQQASATPPVDV